MRLDAAGDDPKRPASTDPLETTKMPRLWSNWSGFCHNIDQIVSMCMNFMKDFDAPYPEVWMDHIFLDNCKLYIASAVMHKILAAAAKGQASIPMDEQWLIGEFIGFADREISRQKSLGLL